ncbi:uncharacterized protein LOC111272605 [Varroa jacobsoni]|uniref:SGNH hydrolase-type esterase domain-containing protein n=1 Tax=Varroa destructor TaxID=109461 RepID=A0A7M7KS48_VARDE|nr:uncharacterized protein LOC111254507 [Varroa destructor]XP_022709902.1 uncharacterized protein LOC111272605 [Varroa jacobsoni]
MPLTIIAGKCTVTKAVGDAEVSRLIPRPCLNFQIREPWVALVGDCFFFRICDVAFAHGALHPDDCPAVISYPRGRIGPTMDLAEQVLPRSIETLFVHLGSNDLSSPSSNPVQVVTYLEERLYRLQILLPSLRTVIICLLTARTTDLVGHYDMNYIHGCNQRMALFNDLVLSGIIRGVKFTVRYLDFYLSKKNLPSLLRVTGFGLNGKGRAHIGGIIENLILKDLRLERNLIPFAYAVPPNYIRSQDNNNYNAWPIPNQPQQPENLVGPIQARSRQWQQPPALFQVGHPPSSIGVTIPDFSAGYTNLMRPFN